MSTGLRDRLLNAMIVVLGLCALATTSMAAYRTFRPPTPVTPPPATSITAWRGFGAAGHRFGPRDAPVTIVEFSDFQCPYCREAAATLKAARIKYNGQVAVVYRHYPL
jgi:hypothetical protein